MGWLERIFATKIQANSLIANTMLVGLQVYILWELNGKLYEILMSKDPVAIGTVFGPTIALVWIARRYADTKGNYEE